jgi:hypothetical protein
MMGTGDMSARRLSETAASRTVGDMIFVPNAGVIPLVYILIPEE